MSYVSSRTEPYPLGRYTGFRSCSVRALARSPSSWPAPPPQLLGCAVMPAAPACPSSPKLERMAHASPATRVQVIVQLGRGTSPTERQSAVWRIGRPRQR